MVIHIIVSVQFPKTSKQWIKSLPNGKIVLPRAVNMVNYVYENFWICHSDDKALTIVEMF